MLSENENVMIIENEHEIYFNGISMEEVVKGSLRTKIIKTRNIKKENGNKIATIACSKENVERSQ
jgi:hypothetical protein